MKTESTLLSTLFFLVVTSDSYDSTAGPFSQFFPSFSKLRGESFPCSRVSTNIPNLYFSFRPSSGNCQGVIWRESSRKDLSL